MEEKNIFRPKENKTNDIFNKFIWKLQEVQLYKTLDSRMQHVYTLRNEREMDLYLMYAATII